MKSIIEDVLSKCSKRLDGLYKVQRELTVKRKKCLAEGAIFSNLEVVSVCSETNITRLEDMRSKPAIMPSEEPGEIGGKTQGCEELTWQ